MSYNCDTFKVKKLDKLVIPLDALYKIKYHDKSWIPDNPEVIDVASNKVLIRYCDSAEIEGILQGDNLRGLISGRERT